MKIRLQKHMWFIMGLVAVLLAAPGPTIVRVAIQDIDPFLYNAVRFLLVSIVLFPCVIKYRHKLQSKNLYYSVITGLYMTAAVVSFVSAIKLSQASYVAVIQLLSPLIFIILSAKLLGEKISKSAKLGITFAALGAFIIIFMPIALAQKEQFTFYPAATFLGILNAITLPLSIIYYRKANEEDLPIVSVFGISSMVVASICIVLTLATDSVVSFEALQNTGVFASILYMSLVIALIARLMNVLSYEHIGAAVSSILGYLEIFLAILIPIIILHESLSIEIVIGGVLILYGVYVAEHHKIKHHKHFHFMKHH